MKMMPTIAKKGNTHAMLLEALSLRRKCTKLYIDQILQILARIVGGRTT
jgi:hypothetical protein